MRRFRHVMARGGLVAAATAVLLGAGLSSAAPASAAAISCTIQGAGTYTVGSVLAWDAASCPSQRGWLRVSLKPGDAFTIQFQSASGVNPGFRLYSPSLTDFQFGSGKAGDPVCWDGMIATFDQDVCEVPFGGSWIMSLTRSGTIAASSVATPATSASSVKYSCLVATAPTARARVPQYSFAQECEGQHERSLWALSLYRGDRLKLSLRLLLDPVPGAGGFLVYPRGVDDYTLGSTSAMCGTWITSTQATLRDCGTITSTGRYVVGAAVNMRFVPLVTHAVTNSVTKPTTARAGTAVTIIDKLTSPAGTPKATCKLQRKSGTSWTTLKSVASIDGKCTIRHTFSKGTKTLRIHQVGATGWASHVLPAWTLTVS